MTAPPDRFRIYADDIDGVMEFCAHLDDAGAWVRYSDHTAAIAALEAERDRLRAALEGIATMQTTASARPWTHEVAADTYWSLLDRMKHVARAALGAGQ